MALQNATSTAGYVWPSVEIEKAGVKYRRANCKRT